MSVKFPTKAPTYTTEKLSKNRVAIFEDGEYICQLRPEEVKAWLFRAEESAKRYVENQAYCTVQRIICALEYLAVRAARKAETAKQLELF